MACPGGSEITIHGLRDCIERHWDDEDFVTLKIDFQNAFNIVSRQALLEECHTHFPELLPWASWCYGQHPMLFHPMGTISSETGVQQGDPLGPLFFCLVLHKLVATIASDEEASHLLYHKWYMDISRNWRSKGSRGIRSLRNSMSIENVWTHSENCS